MLLELTTPALLLILSAYLLGSISSAVLVCQLFGLKDPRTYGSQNPGTTNVWRSGSRRAALITLLADLSKGILPVWLALQLQFDSRTAILCGLGAMLGHLFPLYFQFRGGKGVATFLGVCLALQPVLALGQCSLWLIIAGLFRRSSQASIITALATPLLGWWLIPEYLLSSVLPVLSLMALLLILCHRSNIRNLLRGSESRL